MGLLLPRYSPVTPHSVTSDRHTLSIVAMLLATIDHTDGTRQHTGILLDAFTHMYAYTHMHSTHAHTVDYCLLHMRTNHDAHHMSCDSCRELQSMHASCVLNLPQPCCKHYNSMTALTAGMLYVLLVNLIDSNDTL